MLVAVAMNVSGVVPSPFSVADAVSARSPSDCLQQTPQSVSAFFRSRSTKWVDDCALEGVVATLSPTKAAIGSEP
jgi:hypothetical protein